MTFITSHRHELFLPKRGLLEIPDAKGLQVTCRQGCLWVTLDHDPRDIVLEAGEAFVTGQHRRALVYALQDSTMVLRPEPREALVPPQPASGFMRMRKALAA